MTNPNETVGYTNRYGSVETNGLVNGSEYHSQVDYSRFWSLSEVAEAGGKISRVRLLKEMGRADVSYIHASLPDGRTVNVSVGIGNLIPMFKMKAEMIAWAKREGVYAKGIGLLDEGNWSTVD